MFYIGEDGQITPVQNPDETKLDDLIDYEREQKVIMDNTKALLSGKPAANILLTGDAGTGKSSTVKAVVNELCDNGLRIIEVRKEQLHGIPKILDELNTNPLKFILFIDDLSFTKDDDNFSALKAILEGSVSAKSNNVVIYATSNRRHLVKESFSDREGDDVHFNDTMQEILSLSERFGIQLTFSRPDKATYLDIVHNLADKQGIAYDTEKLDTAAEKFALKRGTRSARAAKQFIDGIVAGSITDIR
ncbi:MAG: ATP-binding protein, partial [Clostridia bacterium]|nr:ATP-binding protein [Clostridia bacterium]